ncbi:MAG: two-component sensor histidine kinase, partial [Clostridiales bacterium]|nr:two-component sensor histidine kinase [Clostridiales bacterium]
MIRKLRVKFIAMSMLSLLVVLLAIMGSVNLVNYQGIVEDADQVLDILADNNGAFPRQESQSQKQGDGSAPPSDSRLGGLRELSPELPYESRYFSVLLNSGGEVETVDTGKIAAVDTSAAIEYAQEAMSRGAERGFLSDYRYAITSDESGTRVIFLDCGRNLSTFYSFLRASCGISAVGLAAVLLLMG